jgi:hypothetical protein
LTPRLSFQSTGWGASGSVGAKTVFRSLKLEIAFTWTRPVFIDALALSVMSTTFRQQILDTCLLHKLQGRGVETILFNFSPKGEFQRADMEKDRYPNFETVSAGCPEGIVHRVAAALGEFVHEKAPVNSGAQLKMFLAEKHIEGGDPWSQSGDPG